MVFPDIVQAFKGSLKGIDWMDKESAKAAAEKADAIRVKVGYPEYPDTLSARSIANYYRTVHIDSRKFLDNMLSAA
jgi:Predicted metalloendopeptidase